MRSFGVPISKECSNFLPQGFQFPSSSSSFRLRPSSSAPASPIRMGKREGGSSQSQQKPWAFRSSRALSQDKLINANPAALSDVLHSLSPYASPGSSSVPERYGGSDTRTTRGSDGDIPVRPPSPIQLVDMGPTLSSSTTTPQPHEATGGVLEPLIPRGGWAALEGASLPSHGMWSDTSSRVAVVPDDHNPKEGNDDGDKGGSTPPEGTGGETDANAPPLVLIDPLPYPPTPTSLTTTTDEGPPTPPTPPTLGRSGSGSGLASLFWSPRGSSRRASHEKHTPRTSIDDHQENTILTSLEEEKEEKVKIEERDSRIIEEKRREEEVEEEKEKEREKEREKEEEEEEEEEERRRRRQQQMEKEEERRQREGVEATLAEHRKGSGELWVEGMLPLTGIYVHQMPGASNDDMVSLLREENELLRRRVNILLAEKSGFQHQVDVFRDDIVMLLDEKVDLMSQLNKLLVEHAELLEQKESVERSCADLQHQADLKEREIATFRRDVEKYRLDMVEITLDNLGLQEQIEVLNGTVGDLKDRIRILRGIITTFDDEKVEIVKELNRLLLKYNELLDEKTQVEGLLRSATTELASITSPHGMVERLVLGAPTGLHSCRSLKTKVELLNFAIERGDQNGIIMVALFLQETLKEEVFYKQLASRPVALHVFTRYLESRHRWDTLASIYQFLDRPKEQGLAMIRLAFEMKDEKKKLDALIDVLPFLRKHKALHWHAEQVKGMLYVLDRSIQVQEFIEDVKEGKEKEGALSVLTPLAPFAPMVPLD